MRQDGRRESLHSDTNETHLRDVRAGKPAETQSVHLSCRIDGHGRNTGGKHDELNF